MDLSKLLDDLGAAGEDRTAIEKFFTDKPEAATKLNGWRENGLRQSDYDRLMNGSKAEITAEKERLKQAEQDLLKARDGMNGQFEQALKDKETSETRLAALIARTRRVATEYGVSEDEFKIDGVSAPPASATVTPPANVDTSKFVSREEFEKVQQIASRLPMLAIRLPQMQREHIRLFGKEFDEQNLLDRAMKENRDIDTVFEQEFGITAKRKEVEEATIRADERSKAEAEFRARQSQENVNTVRTDIMPRSPLFQMKPIDVQRVAANRTSSGVAGAIAAFEAGKYAEKKSA